MNLLMLLDDEKMAWYDDAIVNFSTLGSRVLKLEIR
jgi:hypothetical protein